MRRFAGTAHFVAPGRLRNDTGQAFEEAIYVDFDKDKIYEIPSLAAGAEVDLNRLQSSQASFNDPAERFRQASHGYPV